MRFNTLVLFLGLSVVVRQQAFKLLGKKKTTANPKQQKQAFLFEESLLHSKDRWANASGFRGQVPTLSFGKLAVYTPEVGSRKDRRPCGLGGPSIVSAQPVPSALVWRLGTETRGHRKNPEKHGNPKPTKDSIG